MAICGERIDGSPERFLLLPPRAARVVFIRHILGGKFEGVLGCDFYAGYDGIWVPNSAAGCIYFAS